MAIEQTSVQQLKMVIGGQSVDAADGRTFDVVDPANGQVTAQVPLGGAEDVERAVAAAQKAFEDPSGWPTGRPASADGSSRGSPRS